MDAFAELLKRLAIEQGVPEKCIYTSQAYLDVYKRQASFPSWEIEVSSEKENVEPGFALEISVMAG